MKSSVGGGERSVPIQLWRIIDFLFKNAMDVVSFLGLLL
jgi:hypothetical protein